MVGTQVSNQKRESLESRIAIYNSLRRGLRISDKSGREILYRYLRPIDDVNAITEILHEAYAPLLAAGMRFMASHQSPLTTLYRMSKGETIVALDGDQLVGTITLADIAETSGSPFYDRSDVADFGQFAVRPSHQGRGIGSTLLQLVEDRAQEKGVVELALNTSEHAAHLIALYEQKGYRFIEHVQWRDVNCRSLVFGKAVGTPVRPASERLAECAQEWNVEVEKTITTETSLIGFGKRDGAPVVLKVIRKKGTEEWRSGEFLKAFDGRGMVPLLEHTYGAVLLRRLTPGNDLVALSMNGRDDEATEIIAGIIEQMSEVISPVEPFAAVEDLGRDFVRLRHTGGDLIPERLILKAEAIYSDLCASQRNVRLLHGDLHHPMCCLTRNSAGSRSIRGALSVKSSTKSAPVFEIRSPRSSCWRARRGSSAG